MTELVHSHADRPGKTAARSAISLVIFLGASALMWPVANRNWLQVMIVPVLLLGLHIARRQEDSGWVKAVMLGFAAAAAAVHALQLVRIMEANVADTAEFDFLAFWLPGRIAAMGQNFYLPEHYQTLAAGLSVSDAFRQSILNVGFWYPPPTILLFLPLGWFDPQTALVLWYIVQTMALVACVVLLKDIFAPGEGALTGLAIAVLVLALHATRLTYWLAQTNFLVLLSLLLFWRNRDSHLGGFWLAVAMVIKLYAAVFLLYLVLHRRWTALLSVGVMLLLLSIAGFVLFGPDIFITYATRDLAAMLPQYAYTEPINQSLLATILRASGSVGSGRSPVWNPLFLSLAGALTTITAWLVFRLRRRDDDLALCLLLLLGLLLFPTALSHNRVVLTSVLLAYWRRRAALPGGVWTVLALIVCTYALSGYQNGIFTFYAIAVNWLLLGIVGWRILSRPGSQLEASAT